ncbi:hypothetical protein IC762_33565 [Bradyrhizobium genosp. L]|uniref:COG3904 family protein n=1 Tax=Bradyrhizobium genosp. L TaxID=83637 RepID=UPI0018A262B3|nr:hypothetical protein [Bradyrhizobium genosp. L]QPF84480.1 hypothetical protein IC762_33565 [Bradyrhizobium genosp. L]
MSADDEETDLHRSSPTGPRVTPHGPRLSPWSQPPQRDQPPRQAAPPRPANVPSQHGIFRPSAWSVVIFVLLLSGVGIRAYQDLSRPGAWEYSRETFGKPTMKSTVVPSVDIDGSGRGRRALAISGDIGAASASWFYDQLKQAQLSPGDVILLSSDGGKLSQGTIMGEVIRRRELATAVGTVDVTGKVRAASCASACVLVYAGGKTRYGVFGSLLGVHRFTVSEPVQDPIAEGQRTQGQLLGYMTKMGVSSRIVELMSQTSDIRWLNPKDALAMNLITTPLERP